MHLTDFFLAVPAPAVYATVALLIGVESLGIPVPGETGIVAAALLTTHPSASVSILGVALAAVLGAVVGDSLGYAIGRRYGWGLLEALGRRFPATFAPEHLAYAAHLFGVYGPLAVFAGRFVALLRMTAGPMAGALHMPYRRFLAANAAGAVVWAGGLAVVVHLLGAAAHRWVTDIGWGLLVVLALIGAVAGRRVTRAFHARAVAYAGEGA